jgi:hypothetical protein
MGRIFGIKIETCEQCIGAVKVTANIDESARKLISKANAVRNERHNDVSNKHPIVNQETPSHLNSKNDDIIELLPSQSKVPSQKSLFK